MAVPGDVEDLAKRSVDRLHAGLGPLGVIALELVGHVDQPAGVDHVVGRVHDAGSCQRFSVLGPLELVVGRARHDPALQLGDRVVPDDAAHGAGSEDVAFLGVDLVGLGRVHPEIPDRPRDRVDVHVGHDHAGLSFFHQQLDEVIAHLPDALDGHPPALEGVLLPGLLDAGLQSQVAAVGRDGGGIAGTAQLGGNPGHVPRLAPDDVHVGPVGADVLGRDVAAAE